MGPNEQKRHFAGLEQIVCLYKHAVELQRGLPNLDGKLERFDTKKWEKQTTPGHIVSSVIYVLRYRWAAPALHISRKKGSYFKTAYPRFCKRRVLFCTKVQSMGVNIPLQSTKYTVLIYNTSNTRDTKSGEIKRFFTTEVTQS